MASVEAVRILGGIAADDSVRQVNGKLNVRCACYFAFKLFWLFVVFGFYFVSKIIGFELLLKRPLSLRERGEFNFCFS